MLLKYSKEDKKYIPISANSFITGFVMGYEWQLSSVEKNSYKKEQFNYTINGNLKWNFFGITIYEELKTYNKIIDNNPLL